ncbi:hypothetical protein [Providencia rettgeri]|uniref:hypothetical protein n=1 Tax=Providencia rettgeri TaxID=587 RepID=UPI0023AB3FD1|nr:hypothetical protein [Providencia rettgeri]
MTNIHYKTYSLCLILLLPVFSRGDVYFDPSLLDEQLGIDPNEVDLSHFSQEGSVPTGTVVVN